MKTNRKGKIIIPAEAKPWPHELNVAHILAKANCQVEFLLKSNIKTADILLDGVEYEIKSPEAFNTNTLEHTLKDAAKQAPNLIISTKRIKRIKDAKIKMFLINQTHKQKQIKRLLMITKQNQIIDIK